MISESRALSGRLVVKHRLLSIILMASVLFGAACHRKNSAPPPPTLSGPDSGLIRTPLAFLAATEDPDGDSFTIQFDWGDGDSSPWSEFCHPDSSVVDSHSWSMPDTYAVRARASDRQGNVSAWSPPHILAIGAQPVTILWSLPIGQNSSGFCSPVLGEDGTIYVANDAGTLIAVRPDGSAKWQAQTGACGGTPAIGDDGTVYVQSGTWLRAIGADGQERWAFPAERGPYPPGLGGDGTVYFITRSGGQLHALDRDGRFKWRSDSCGASGTPAIGTDGTIYVTCMGCLLRAYRSDGTLKWSFTSPTRLTSNAALGADGAVYFAACIPGECGSNLCALDPEGRLMWAYGIPHDNIAHAPVVGQDGTIYYGTWACEDWEFGSLVARRPDGSLKWRIATSDMDSDPVLGSDGTVYAVDYECLRAVDQDGEALWRLPGYGSCVPPTMGQGVLYTIRWGDWEQDDTLVAVAVSGRLAESPWPMHMHDAQHTCRAR